MAAIGIRLQNATSLYMEGIRDPNARKAVTTYTGARYTQHSTGVANGVERFIEFFEPFLERNPHRHIEVMRGWEDSRYVFLHVFQSLHVFQRLNGGEAESVTTDFIDTDSDGKVVEHGDNVEPVPEHDVNSSKF